MEEKQIIQAAIQHFNQLTGLKMNEVYQPDKRLPKNREPDTCVEIQAQGKTYTFWVEVKNELRQVHLGHLIQQLAQDRDNWLLICQYLSKPNRKHLKEEGINYLDASGNCNIRSGALLLFINDQQVAPQRQSNTGKLWKPAGLRLIFSLLLKPELINEPYRFIAKQSKLGLGTIGALLQELEKEKYFSRYNQNYNFENREALLNRWTETYYAILRPKLMQGRFRFASPKDRDNWKNVQLKQVFWGGEPAGALLTKFLHPEKFTVYSDMPKTEVMKQLRLVPSPDGEVELLKTFWNTENTKTQFLQTVPPLLAYAELNASMDSRNREIAERIKKQYNV
jgi:hypothetical protein